MKPFEVVNYAVNLNRYLWTYSDGVNVILYYAVLREAEKIKVSETDALRQIAYMYSRHPDYLPNNITENLDNELGEDIQGSVEDSFDLDAAIDILTEYCQNDSDFRELCVDWYKFYLAFTGDTKFGLEFNNDKYGWCKYFQRQGFFTVPGNVVPASVPKKMLLDWQHKDSPTNIAIFAMYSAIRSIVGRKEVAATTRDFIYARMFGGKNVADLNKMIEDDEQLRDSAADWNPTTHRKKFTKVLDILRAKRLINYYGYGRRTYVSLSSDDDVLARNIAEDVQQNKHGRHNVSELLKTYLNGTP